MSYKSNDHKCWQPSSFNYIGIKIKHVCLKWSYVPNFPGGSAGKESACNMGGLGSIPGVGRSPEEQKGYSLQYSGLENSMDGIVHGVAKSWTRLSDFHFTSCTRLQIGSPVEKGVKIQEVFIVQNKRIFVFIMYTSKIFRINKYLCNHFKREKQ